MERKNKDYLNVCWNAHQKNEEKKKIQYQLEKRNKYNYGRKTDERLEG